MRNESGNAETKTSAEGGQWLRRTNCLQNAETALRSRWPTEDAL